MRAMTSCSSATWARRPSAARDQPKGIVPVRSPAFRISLMAARVRARMRPRSNWAAASITVRMNWSAAPSPLPIPSQLTTFAPRRLTIRSMVMTSMTSRPSRSRLATSKTSPRRRAPMAAARAGRYSMPAAPERPASSKRPVMVMPARWAYASTAAT